MKRNTAHKILTFVQKIIVFKAASVILMSQIGMAQQAQQQPIATNPETVKAIDQVNRAAQDRQICIDKEKEYKKAQQEFSDACSKAGIGGSCGSKMKQCNNYWNELSEVSMSEEEENESAQLFKMLGVSLDPGEEDRAELNGPTFACAKSSEADWEADEEKIKEKISQIKEDISDLEIKTIEKRTAIQKELQDLKEDKVQAETDYNDAIKKLDTDIKDKKKAIESNIESMRNEFRKKDTDYLKLRNSISKLMTEKASAISQSFKICQQQLLQMKGQIAQAKSKSKPAVRSGMKSLTRGSSYEKEQIAKAYNSCLAEAQQQRKAATIEYNSRIAEANKAIVAAEEELKEAQQKMQTATQEMDALVSEQTKQMSQTQQNALKKMSNIAEAITQKETEKSQHQTQAQKRLSELGAQLEDHNKAIGRLGKKPLGATKTIDEVTSAYQKRLGLAYDFYTGNCCTEEDNRKQYSSLCETTKTTYESNSGGGSSSKSGATTESDAK